MLKHIKSDRIIAPPESKRLKAGYVMLKRGEDVGTHVTYNREEIILVLEGEATIMSNNKENIITKDQTFYVPPETEHNVYNKSNRDLKYVYVVTMLD